MPLRPPAAADRFKEDSRSRGRAQTRTVCLRCHCRSPTLALVAAPTTRYARSGDVNIAYQVLGGEGSLDILFVHGFVGNMEALAEQPGHEVFFEHLASLGRVIRFDRRGTGLSDRVREVPTLEARMDDLRAVMDAASSRRAALVATFEAASMAMVYAATYPERVAALALYNPTAKGLRSPDYPWGLNSEEESGGPDRRRPRPLGNPGVRRRLPPGDGAHSRRRPRNGGVDRTSPPARRRARVQPR